jgi:hypothetical protein
MRTDPVSGLEDHIGSLARTCRDHLRKHPDSRPGVTLQKNIQRHLGPRSDHDRETECSQVMAAARSGCPPSRSPSKGVHPPTDGHGTLRKRQGSIPGRQISLRPVADHVEAPFESKTETGISPSYFAATGSPSGSSLGVLRSRAPALCSLDQDEYELLLITSITPTISP